MNALSATACPPPARPERDDWRMIVRDEVGSTNSHAGALPAWTAVRANTQTGGRGRTRERHWVSDEGGLWLSAVLPCPGARAQWEILPLAAGWAVLRALRDLGVAGLRLRWPNDLMLGRRKLAGLLVERFRPDTAVVGIGLNLHNRPERANPALAGQTVRLSDILPGDHSVDEVGRIILCVLRDMHAILLDHNFQLIADQLNLAWAEPQRVEITLHGQPHRFAGLFQGIDPRGRLRLLTEHGRPCVYDATQVALLRELD